MTRYAIISYRWNGNYEMYQPRRGESIDTFWKKHTHFYCSVMFQSDDECHSWFVDKTHGVGAIDKIIKIQDDYLPKPIPEPSPTSKKEYNTMSVKKVIMNPHKPIGITYSGVEVLNVEHGSQAWANRIGVGWGILEINGEKCINDSLAIEADLKKAKVTGKSFTILFSVKKVSYQVKKDYIAKTTDELTIKKGEILDVWNANSNVNGMSYCEFSDMNDKKGWVPSDHLEKMPEMEVLMEGYLEKRSKRSSTWAKVFFQVRGDYLIYDGKKIKQKMLCLQTAEVKPGSKENEFKLHAKTVGSSKFRTYIFLASNKTMKEVWIEALLRERQQIHKPSSRVASPKSEELLTGKWQIVGSQTGTSKKDYSFTMDLKHRNNSVIGSCSNGATVNGFIDNDGSFNFVQTFGLNNITDCKVILGDESDLTSPKSPGEYVGTWKRRSSNLAGTFKMRTSRVADRSQFQRSRSVPIALSISKAGYLEKKSKRSSRLVKTYFRVKGDFLVYDGKKDRQKMLRLQTATIQLGPKENEFKLRAEAVSHSRFRTYEFSAANADERNAWVAALKRDSISKKSDKDESPGHKQRGPQRNSLPSLIPRNLLTTPTIQEEEIPTNISSIKKKVSFLSSSRHSLFSVSKLNLTSDQDVVGEYDLPTIDLKLTIISANNVPKMDTFGTCDPYVKITVQTANGTKITKSTSIQYKTLTPVWNECLMFNNIIASQKIEFIFLDKDRLKSDVIGTATLDLDSYTPEEILDQIAFNGDLLVTSKHAWKGKDITIKYKGTVTKVSHGNSQPLVQQNVLERHSKKLLFLPLTIWLVVLEYWNMDAYQKMKKYKSTSRSSLIIKDMGWFPSKLTIEETLIFISMMKFPVKLLDLSSYAYNNSSLDLIMMMLDKRLTQNSFLTRLELDGIQIGNNKVQMIAENLESNTTLTELNLGSNMLSDMATHRIGEALKVNQTLTFLDLSNNQITDGGTLSLLHDLIMNNTLILLNLMNNDIKSSDAHILSKTSNKQSSGNKLLINLNVPLKKFRNGTTNMNQSGQSYNDNDAVIISALLHMYGVLLKLDLFYNKIGDIGAKALGECIKDNKTITHLRLGSNNISDVGAEKIAMGLAFNNVLKSLWLDNNQIGDMTAAIFASGLKNNFTLTKLDLSYNQISNTGAEALTEALGINKTLKTIYLQMNQITEDGKKAMLDALKSHGSLKTCKLQEPFNCLHP